MKGIIDFSFNHIHQKYRYYYNQNIVEKCLQIAFFVPICPLEHNLIKI